MDLKNSFTKAELLNWLLTTNDELTIIELFSDKDTFHQVNRGESAEYNQETFGDPHFIYLSEFNDDLKHFSQEEVLKYYGNEFDELRTIFNDFDLLGLFAKSGNPNEYDPVLKTCLVFYEQVRTLECIRVLLIQEFYRWHYNFDFRYENTERLANEIYQWKLQNDKNLKQASN